MGDHNTCVHELWKMVDNLKGSMDIMASSLSDSRQMMDAKVTQAMDEIKKNDIMQFDHGKWRTVVGGSNSFRLSSNSCSNHEWRLPIAN